MGSTIVNTGEKIVCDDTMTVFVHGAYNLGAVLENREVGTDTPHPGEGLEHDAGADGEDLYTLHIVVSARAYGLCEVDFGMIADCSVSYAIGDDIPAIPYHMNPGAYVRNVVCVDPTADVESDQPLLISPATAGRFIPLIEEAMVDTNGTGNGECFPAGVVIGDAGGTYANRIPMRAAYWLTDPNAAFDCVAYITHG